jgi:hypothetical protein
MRAKGRLPVLLEGLHLLIPEKSDLERGQQPCNAGVWKELKPS